MLHLSEFATARISAGGSSSDPLGSLPRAAGEAQLFAMRGNANIPPRSGLAMGTMGGYCLHLSTLKSSAR